MRYIKAALIFALLPCGMALAADDYADKYPGYILAWHDEFDTGSDLDRNKWEYEEGYKRNHEAQYYSDKNTSIAEGKLIIEARKDDQGHAFTSASVIARDRFHYGIYEVCAKIPVGAGYWPAIWSTGNKGPWPYCGEIDIMEYYDNSLLANACWGGAHRKAIWDSSKIPMSEFEDDFADKYHIWKMEWTPEAIKLYVDDRLLNTIELDKTVNENPAPRRMRHNPEDVGNEEAARHHAKSLPMGENYNPFTDPDNRHGVWLNLALGGDNGGSLEDTPFPARYYIDWARVYVPVEE